MSISISILVPSRGPVPVFTDMLMSLSACTAEPERVEIIARFDDDDPDLDARIGALMYFARNFQRQELGFPRAGMGAMTVQMAHYARGDSLWLLNDDVIHETYGWDRLVREVVAQRPAHAFFPDDGLFGEELACFPLLPRAHVVATGFFGIERYERYHIDSIIADIYDGRMGLDRMVYLPQWKIKHLNTHPVSEIDTKRFHRETKDGQVYQPADPEVLARDEARYLGHFQQLGPVKAQIKAMDALVTQ